MLAEYLTDYHAGATTATWSRLVAPNRNHDLASDGVTRHLFECHESVAHLAACFYDWGKSHDKYLTVQLELTDDHGKNHLRMLKRVHDTTDWSSRLIATSASSFTTTRSTGQPQPAFADT